MHTQHAAPKKIRPLYKVKISPATSTSMKKASKGKHLLQAR